MKKFSHHHFLTLLKGFLGIYLVISLTGCSTIKETISSKKDARHAYHLEEAYVRNYKFNDILSLRILLKDRLSEYEKANAYLKKKVGKMIGKDKVLLERKVVKIERLINIAHALVDNLILLYPDEWNKERESLNSYFDELYHHYRRAYNKIN